MIYKMMSSFFYLLEKSLILIISLKLFPEEETTMENSEVFKEIQIFLLNFSNSF